MDYSLLLAKLFGIYLVIIGLAYVIRRDFLISVVNDFYDSPGLIAVASALNLVIGLILVLTHSLWEFNYKGLVTLFGYLILFKGILNLFAPTVPANWAERMLSGSNLLYAAGASLLLGLYLSYVGFVG